MSDIPLIDLEPSLTGSTRDREAVARRLDEACRDVGFFAVPALGVAPSVIDSTFGCLRRFFDVPASEKDACRLPSGFTFAADDYTPYGYSGLLEENAFAYMGEQGKPSDYVEKYSTGRLILNDDLELPFPKSEVGAALRSSLKSYYTAINDLSNLLLQLFTIPLGLPADYLTSRVDRSNDSLRCHRYPAKGPHYDNTQGMGAHMDGSLITLLTHDNPGIEVRTLSGEWLVPSFRSASEVIVNVGDLLAHWTKNRYVSTPHRVVMGERERISVVFFKLTNEDEVTEIGNRQMDALFGR